MSSEPSERAKDWVVADRGDHCYTMGDMRSLRAFDAGYSEGEKKGTAAGYLKALRELTKDLRSMSREANWRTGDNDGLTIAGLAIPRELVGRWLDRRIREAEENANG